MLIDALLLVLVPAVVTLALAVDLAAVTKKRARTLEARALQELFDGIGVPVITERIRRWRHYLNRQAIATPTKQPKRRRMP
jgi:hypothetical protein